ncbi:Endoplasmic reticulum aminopeptidase 2 [Tupaia chinensis]|uniref:Endoplasmic reticulum aminopeptidase 2 n=1 Tax=Tupaia chinensis TaxID=246437 RepID=L8Y5B5_TUPCH|nr:Endoplasmic reticulum aminopeptidase 2 [Tupaia chinensis]
MYLIAIPDFESGAMENWGLITYRETSLLFDPRTSSAADKLWVTRVIAHELAHQWFGNLVTMEWWNDIWLNEGFANYMELLSLNATFPELQFGACILNMLKNFLNDEKFQKGIIHYLKEFSYRNAKNDDLWNSLSNLTFPKESVEVKEMMTTWTLQKGIPLVVVKRDGDSLTIQQERFLKGVFKEDPEWKALQERYLWQIPLTYSTSSSDVIHRHILKSKTDTLDLPDKNSWVKFNVDSNGYYMVHYEEPGWDELIKQLNQNHSLLRPKDRIGLIHDAFQLVSAGRLSLDKALDLTRYLPRETSSPALLKGLQYLELFYRMVDRRNISDVSENLKTTVGWNYLLEQYELSVSGAEKNKILYALSTSKHPEKLLKFDLGSFAVRMIISGTTSHFSSKDEFQEVKLFFDSLKAQGLHLDIFQTVLETIDKNIKWLEKNLPTLRTWLLASI